MMIIHLETVVGTKVRDVDGKVAGRLKDVCADWRGSECIVNYYVLRFRPRLIVPWDKMDWSDPLHPRLTCRASELRSVPR